MLKKYLTGKTVALLLALLAIKPYLSRDFEHFWATHSARKNVPKDNVAHIRSQ
jgi:hypothetical protein